MISIRYFPPAEPLKALISSYYLFHAELPQVRDLLRAELAQVRFILAGQGVYRFADGRVVDCPRAMLNGPTAAPIIFEAQGPLTVFGVGLMPAGWAALLGCSADALADNMVPLGDVIGAIAERTLERLVDARDVGGRITAVDAMFLSLSARAYRAPLWFTQAADAWLTGSLSPQVDSLVEASGVSGRQVERLARRIYGASPKLLARKYRALQAAVRLGTGQAGNWVDAAGDAFYDQPHFIREFKQFVGMTPHRFQIESAPVMRLTIAGRRQLASMPKLALYS